MIHLLAIAPEDGWAFARSGERIYLLRPPYDKRRHQVVDEGSVERAVAVEGFAAADQAFSGWPALFAHLKEVSFSGRPPLTATLAPATVERILRHAPPSALESLLDRIEQELAVNRQLGGADAPALTRLREQAAGLLVR